MSDSSEDEDLSRFKEVVDTSFTNFLQGTVNKTKIEEQKPKSDRHLEESSHYNDVKVPEKMQHQIGNKISTIISKKVEFVEVEPSKIENPILEGGVKLFNTSKGFLSCEDVKDVNTELHNKKSRGIKPKKRQIEEQEFSDNDKIVAVAVSGESILMKEDTTLWKSRRKEKLFKYKMQGKSKVLMSVD